MFDKATHVISRFTLITLFLYVGIAFSDSWAYTEEECKACHGMGSHKSRLTISLEVYSASIHARNGITCGDCHGDVLDEDHETREGTLQVGCLQCHDQVNRHGGETANAHRPKCYDCHGAHDILEKERHDSAVHWNHLTATCRKCHFAECERDRRFFLIPAFRLATHVKQDFSETYERSHCLGCHQAEAAHGGGDIIHKADCYRCHQSGGERPKLLGRFHEKPDLKHQPGFFLATVLNEVIILVLLCCGLVFVVQWFVVKRRGAK